MPIETGRWPNYRNCTYYFYHTCIQGNIENTRCNQRLIGYCLCSVVSDFRKAKLYVTCIHVMAIFQYANNTDTGYEMTLR